MPPDPLILIQCCLQAQLASLKAVLGKQYINFFDKVEGLGDTTEVHAYISAIKDFAPNVSMTKSKSSHFKESQFTMFLIDPVFRDLPLYDKYVPSCLVITTFTFFFTQGCFCRFSHGCQKV
jgi:hypothetical protein